MSLHSLLTCRISCERSPVSLSGIHSFILHIGYPRMTLVGHSPFLDTDATGLLWAALSHSIPNFPIYKKGKATWKQFSYPLSPIPQPSPPKLVVHMGMCTWIENNCRNMHKCRKMKKKNLSYLSFSSLLDKRLCIEACSSLLLEPHLWKTKMSYAPFHSGTWPYFKIY